MSTKGFSDTFGSRQIRQTVFESKNPDACFLNLVARKVSFFESKIHGGEFLFTEHLKQKGKFLLLEFFGIEPLEERGICRFET